MPYHYPDGTTRENKIKPKEEKMNISTAKNKPKKPETNFYSDKVKRGKKKKTAFHFPKKSCEK